MDSDRNKITVHFLNKSRDGQGGKGPLETISSNRLV